MHQYLDAQRRILFQAYRRYLAADRALQIAQSAALAWFPNENNGKTVLIGGPGSRMRRLCDRRDRALARLKLARQELKDAQSRSGAKRVTVVRLISSC